LKAKEKIGFGPTMCAHAIVITYSIKGIMNLGRIHFYTYNFYFFLMYITCMSYKMENTVKAKTRLIKIGIIISVTL